MVYVFIPNYEQFVNGLQVMRPADRELILLDSLEPEGFGDSGYQDIFRFCNIRTAISPVLGLFVDIVQIS